MSIQELVNLWPRDWAELKDDRARSNGQNLTVRKVLTEYGVGLAFEGDDTPVGEYAGAIWNVKGDWNEDARRPRVQL